jgi:hypothetical protein
LFNPLVLNCDQVHKRDDVGESASVFTGYGTCLFL